MSNCFKNLLIVSLIAIVWVALEAVNQSYFDFLKVTDFSYSIYLLSGLRLVAIVLFGWVGFWGILIGYYVGSFFLREFSIVDAAFLGLLSTLAPMIAYRYWQRAANKGDDFDHVSFIKLCYLVFLYSFLTALFRNLYFFFAGKTYGIEQIATTFSANVIGSFVFLYLLVFCNRLYKRLR